MNNIEKALASITIAGTLIGIGVSWNSLNNRIDKVDEKIGAIQKTLGSTACTAILTRQIEAIEKDRDEALKAMEGLSSEYGCVPRHDAYLPTTLNDVQFNGMNAADVANLSAQLNAVDIQLNEGR